jgi:hypothetical protein
MCKVENCSDECRIYAVGDTIRRQNLSNDKYIYLLITKIKLTESNSFEYWCTVLPDSFYDSKNFERMKIGKSIIINYKMMEDYHLYEVFYQINKKERLNYEN